MFCEQCGQKITDGSLFCEYCGARVAIPVQPQSDIPVQPQSNIPVQPQGGYVSYQPYGTDAAAATPITKSQIMIIVIIAEVFALIFAIFGMNSFVGNKFSAKAYAQKYFVSVANADIKTAYELADIEESAFVNQQSFENYLAQQEDLSKVSEYEVVSDYSDGVSKNVCIEYVSSVSGNTSSYYVTLVRDSKKNLGIFDSWKVSLGDIYSYNFKIIAQKGATVTFDGVVLGDEYKTTDEDVDSERADVYVIPKMFAGSHQIDAALEGYNSISKTDETYAGSDQIIYVTGMTMTEDYVKSIENNVYENIKTIYNAALNGQSFESLPVAFCSDGIEYTKEQYEYLKQYFNDRECKVTGVDFCNIKITSNTYGGAVAVSFDYVVHYMDYENNNRTTNSSFSGYTDMVLQDGQWVQASLCADTLTYLLGW